jgi:predicted DCC family thiol-disulfide oxidoreductase YuxK
VADPDGPILVYDGDCSFCTAWALWVAARWRVPARAVAGQTLEVDRLAALGLTNDDIRAAAWWIDASARRSRGHLAIAHALAATSGLSAALGRLLLVPPFRWVAAAAYTLIVRYRRFLPAPAS